MLVMKPFTVKELGKNSDRHSMVVGHVQQHVARGEIGSYVGVGSDQKRSSLPQTVGQNERGE